MNINTISQNQNTMVCSSPSLLLAIEPVLHLYYTIYNYSCHIHIDIDTDIGGFVKFEHNLIPHIYIRTDGSIIFTIIALAHELAHVIDYHERISRLIFPYMFVTKDTLYDMAHDQTFMMIFSYLCETADIPYHEYIQYRTGFVEI